MVFNRADRGFLANIEINSPALRRCLFLNPYILEVAGTPDGAQISLQSAFIVDIPWTCVDFCLDALNRNTTISSRLDLLDDLPLLGMGKAAKAEKRDKDQGNARRPEDIFRPYFFRKQQCRATLRTSWESFDYTEVIAEAPLIEVGHAFLASRGENYTLLQCEERPWIQNLHEKFRIVHKFLQDPPGPCGAHYFLGLRWLARQIGRAHV